jgi:putative ABC transport system permease protein
MIRALVAAVPVAWQIIGKLLQNLACRFELNRLIFNLAAFRVQCIAMFTVSCQSFRVAISNPVEAIRYELIPQGYSWDQSPVMKMEQYTPLFQ